MPQRRSHAHPLCRCRWSAHALGGMPALAQRYAPPHGQAHAPARPPPSNSHCPQPQRATTGSPARQARKSRRLALSALRLEGGLLIARRTLVFLWLRPCTYTAAGLHSSLVAGPPGSGHELLGLGRRFSLSVSRILLHLICPVSPEIFLFFCGHALFSCAKE